MVTTAEFPSNAGSLTKPMPSACGNWTLYEYPVVTSTNLVAAKLPAWTAVRATIQTEGRGRFQRSWVSDRGGLWLSAVVPVGQDKIARRALPLAAGLTICNVLRELESSAARLRWPNDVLIGNRKLAGILIDQFEPNLAVIGIGMNVRNRPESCDPALLNHTARLTDLMPTPPELRILTALILQQLRQVSTELNRDGAQAVLLNANKLWGSPRAVELDLDGKLRRGLFTAVDPQGRLALSDANGGLTFYEAHEVRHLTEI
jgi:BirA family biotin operon repressor/biotin-[acetyl-CoA-carboxylase] ligase